MIIFLPETPPPNILKDAGHHISGITYLFATLNHKHGTANWRCACPKTLLHSPRLTKTKTLDILGSWNLFLMGTQFGFVVVFAVVVVVLEIVKWFTSPLLGLQEPQRIWQFLLDLNVLLKSYHSIPSGSPMELWRMVNQYWASVILFTAVKSSVSPWRALLFLDPCPRNQCHPLTPRDLSCLKACWSIAGPSRCWQQAAKTLKAPPTPVPNLTQEPYLVPNSTVKGKICYSLFPWKKAGGEHTLEPSSDAFPSSFCSIIQSLRGHSLKPISRMQRKWE